MKKTILFIVILVVVVATPAWGVTFLHTLQTGDNIIVSCNGQRLDQERNNDRQRTLRCIGSTTTTRSTTVPVSVTTPTITLPTTTLPLPTDSLQQGDTRIGWLQLGDEVTDAEASSFAPRVDLTVLTPWFTASAQKLKAANPGMRVLAYHDIYVTVNDGFQSNGTTDWNMPFSGGMGYAWTSQNHPDWFSLNSSGQRYQFTDYPGRYVMKVGLPAYQNQFAQNIIAEAQQYGYNGIFLDDALPHIAHGINQSPDYDTNAEVKNATASFITNVCGQLKNAGLLCIPNVAGIALENGLWNEWDQLGTGLFEEKFVFWNNSPSQWQGADISKYMAQGIPQPNSSLTQFNVFNTYGNGGVHDSLVNVAHALFLAYNDGVAIFTVSSVPDGYNQPPYISTEMGWNLGRETSARQEITPYTFIRKFEKGAVVVRIDEGGGTVNVNLGGTYYDRNGIAFSSVSLGNKSAKILKTNSGTGAP